MPLIEKSKTYFFSSSESLGAFERSALGSTFQVELDRPLRVPPSAINVSIECVAANIWRTTPNISHEYDNDVLQFNDTLFNFKTIIIPKGVYGIGGLNEEIERQMLDMGYPADTIVFGGNNSTQRATVTVAAGFQLVTDPGFSNIAPTLGFTDGLPKIAGYSVANEVAKLNRINEYLIHCNNLVQGGISINNKHDGILTEVQIDVLPGNLITYRPYIPYVIDGNHLKLGGIDHLEFRLTDEQDRLVDTNGETWSCSVMIKYMIDSEHLFHQGSVPSTNGMIF